jgi:hypothetical protein
MKALTEYILTRRRKVLNRPEGILIPTVALAIAAPSKRRAHSEASACVILAMKAGSTESKPSETIRSDRIETESINPVTRKLRENNKMATVVLEVDVDEYEDDESENFVSRDELIERARELVEQGSYTDRVTEAEDESLIDPVSGLSQYYEDTTDERGYKPVRLIHWAINNEAGTSWQDPETQARYAALPKGAKVFGLVSLIEDPDAKVLFCTEESFKKTYSPAR